MVVSIEIPKEAEAALRGAYGENLSRAMVEAMAAEGYRSGKLSRHEVQVMLGFDNRWDVEAWLGERGLHLNYSVADLQADRETLDRVLGPVRP